MDRRTRALALLSGAITLVALRLWQGEDYWNYSEGVYSLTARLWLHGADLYGSMVGAQPPGVFLAGAALVGLHDSLEFLRWGVGLVELGTALLAAVGAFRLSGSRAAAVITPALVLLAPWTVHESGTLTPEPLAGPLLLGGALLAARPRTSAAGGAVAALAIGFKLPFLLPVLGIVALAADRRRAALAALAATALMVASGLLLFGEGLFRDAVTAQLHSGYRGLHLMAGILGQAGWSLLGLLAAGLALAVAGRGRIRDVALARVWIGLVAGLGLTVLTTAKQGTGLNVLVPVEAALVPVAAAGCALVAQIRGRVVALGGVAFTLAQSGALIAIPRDTVTPFIYPTSERGAWGRLLTGQQVEAAAAVARACPPGVAFSGPPLLAFVAHRPPPGGQPDGFLTVRSPTLAGVAAAIAADPRRCP